MPIKPLYSVFNSLYNGIMDYMPEFIQDRPMTAAVTLGTIGS